MPLLKQRPWAFEYARPLRQWRAQWAPVYEQLLAHLQAERPEGAGFPEFIRILGLDRDNPAPLVEQTITRALASRCVHLDGVRLWLHQLEHPEAPLPALDLSDRPRLAALHRARVDLRRYEALLEGA